MTSLITVNTLNVIKSSIINIFHYTKMFNTIAPDYREESILKLVVNDLIHNNQLKLNNKQFSEKELTKTYIIQNIHRYAQEEITESINSFNFTLQSLEKRHSILKKLQDIPEHKQRSAEWYEFRRSALTASNIVKILNGSESEKENIILDKCGHEKPFFTNAACQHGIKYEDVAIAIYEARCGKKIHEFGCLRHPLFHFLAASPDGITEDGIMVEIKCPYTRKINGIPKKEYYEQMQLQMEVCDLNLCHFLECEIKEYNTEQEFYDDVSEEKNNIMYNSLGLEKGVLLKYIINENEIKYDYGPLFGSKSKLEKWVTKHKKKIKKKQNVESEVIYWKLCNYSCVEVFRNKKWISNHLNTFYDFWTKVLYYRTDNNYKELLEKKEKKAKNKNEYSKKYKSKVCLLIDSSDEEEEQTNSTENFTIVV